MGKVQQFLANGVRLRLGSVDHIGMDVIQYIYTLMSTSRFLMVQRSGQCGRHWNGCHTIHLHSHEHI